MRPHPRVVVVEYVEYVEYVDALANNPDTPHSQVLKGGIR